MTPRKIEHCPRSVNNFRTKHLGGYSWCKLATAQKLEKRKVNFTSAWSSLVDWTTEFVTRASVSRVHKKLEKLLLAFCKRATTRKLETMILTRRAVEVGGFMYVSFVWLLFVSYSFRQFLVVHDGGKRIPGCTSTRSVENWRNSMAWHRGDSPQPLRSHAQTRD